MSAELIRAHGAVLGSVLAFASLIDAAGLVPATLVSVFVAGIGAGRLSTGKAAALAALLAALIAGLFVGLLGLPLRLFGGR